MKCNIPSVNSTVQSVRPLNDPYGSNELNKPLMDRYNAGVLDNPTFFMERKCSRKVSDHLIHLL